MQPNTVYEDIEQFRLFGDQGYGSSLVDFRYVGPHDDCDGEHEDCHWCDMICDRWYLAMCEDVGVDFDLYKNDTDQSLEFHWVQFDEYYMKYIRRGTVYRFRICFLHGRDMMFFYNAFSDEMWWNRDRAFRNFDALPWEVRAGIYWALVEWVGMTGPAEKTVGKDKKSVKHVNYRRILMEGDFYDDDVPQAKTVFVDMSVLDRIIAYYEYVDPVPEEITTEPVAFDEMDSWGLRTCPEKKAVAKTFVGEKAAIVETNEPIDTCKPWEVRAGPCKHTDCTPDCECWWEDHPTGNVYEADAGIMWWYDSEEAKSMIKFIRNKSEGEKMYRYWNPHYCGTPCDGYVDLFHREFGYKKYKSIYYFVEYGDYNLVFFYNTETNRIWWNRRRCAYRGWDEMPLFTQAMVYRDIRRLVNLQKVADGLTDDDLKCIIYSW